MGYTGPQGLPGTSRKGELGWRGKYIRNKVN